MRARIKPYGRILGAAAVLLGCALLLALLSGRVRQSASERQRQILQSAVMRAVLTCYSIEGRYPPNLQYLIDNYGVYIDTQSYVVSYEAFADNLMPDVRVLRKGEGG